MRKFLLTLLLITSLQVFAGGYRVALQGARMLGMAHAGTAVFNGPETVFFNPSGMVFTQGEYQFGFGANFVISHVKYQNAQTLETAQTQNPVGTPFYIYATYKATEHLYLGLGVYTPFGSTVKWDTDWAGSHLVNNISLKAIYFQLSAAYKINDYFSVAASFISATGSVNFNKNVNRFMVDEEGNRTDVELEAKNIPATGYTLAATIRPSDKFSFGISYRSKVIFKARYGKAVFNDRPQYFPEADAFTAELPMPAELDFGMAWKPVKEFTLAFDLNRTYWSVYKSLDIHFNRLGISKLPKKWEDTWTWRVGAEFQLTGNIFLRAGYYKDYSPIPQTYFSPETPSLDSDNYTFGLGYQKGKIGFDLAFLYVNGHERSDSYDYFKEGLTTVKFGGDYVSNAFVPAFGITYKP